MSNISLEKCEWCNGSGIDTEGVAMGNPYACVDCKGTGFKYGKEAKEEHDRQVKEEWELIDLELEKLEKENGI